jgi:MOSC domain-containing protein YiiM
MNLVSLQLGRPRESVSHLKDGNDAKWVSSIWRTPVNERLHLGRTDLAGNAQADLKNHGGPDKAVCCYSAEHYPDWRDLLELSEEEFGYGAFGENFTVTELTENAVCLGDIYALGTATVQVSQPRMPCWKVGRRWERPDLPGEMSRTGRTGFYLRVLTKGEVGAGDTLNLKERLLPEWTVARLNTALYVQKTDQSQDEELSRLPLLAEAWRRTFRRRAGLLRYRAKEKK